MIEIRVSIRYARAIMNAAKELNLVDTVYQDLKYVNETFVNSKEFFTIFKSPVIPNSKKKKIVHEVFAGRVSDLCFSLIDLVISKNRENLINSIFREFEALYFTHKNMLPVNITTAIEIDENTKNNVLSRLNQITGKSIVPQFNIEPKIKGGLKVQIDTWVYDATVENKLQELYHRLTAGNN